MTDYRVGGGLNNLGNTCFFNATLQTILHSPPLAKILLSRSHSLNCTLRAHHQWCVFCQMEQIFAKTRQSRTYSPDNMIRHLKSIFKKFRLGQQEDSHEFLRYLIEGMQQCQTGKLGKDRQANERIIKTTKIFDCFGGIIKTCVLCTQCQYQSITTERYYDLNIQCQQSNSLMEGLTNFFKTDLLGGANKYYCQKCKNRVVAKKRALLDTTPQVATFQLKRFTNMLRKIGKFISFPIQFDMGKYLYEPRKIQMRLFGIIVHAGGSASSGHYYSFVRMSETWYKMDDSYVSKVNMETVLNQNAYILFYQKFEEQLPKNKKIQLISTVISQNNIKNTDKNQTSAISPFEQSNNKLPEKQNEEDNLDNHIVISSKNFQKISLGNISNSSVQKHSLQKKNVFESNKDEEEILNQLPKLKRTKSKEQKQRQIPYSQLLLRAAQKVMELGSKIARERPRNKSLRHVQSLRKYECIMQKRRKIG